MPAETHQHREAVTAEEIVDLLVGVLAGSADSFVGADTLLGGVGVETDLALFDLADVVAEEYGERSLGEVAFEELRSARTVGALAQVFAQRWSPGDNADPARQGEPI